MKLLTNLKKRPKFRIVIHNDKYITQEFWGFWKIGFYFNFGFYKGESFISETFEHDTIEEAEEVIDQAMKESNQKTYIVKEYI